jgi:hypothetical protein
LAAPGGEEAGGDLVAIIEEHCFAAPEWLPRAIEAHVGGDYGVVGGPMLDYNFKRLRDWVVYLYEYSDYFPPWQEADYYGPGSAHIAYFRASAEVQEAAKRGVLGSGTAAHGK